MSLASGPRVAKLVAVVVEVAGMVDAEVLVVLLGDVEAPAVELEADDELLLLLVVVVVVVVVVLEFEVAVLLLTRTPAGVKV
jgi:hypothetical protein